MRAHESDEELTTSVLAGRLETLAAWIGELDTRVRAAEITTGDEKTARELRRAVEALAKHDPKAHDKLTNHVSVLTDRVATLASTVSTATAALAGKDGEIAAVRKELSTASAQIETLAAEVRLASRPGDLDELRRALERLAIERDSKAPDKRVAAVEEKLRLLTERLDSVSGTVSTATASLAGREGELTALRGRLDEDGARLGAAVAELKQTIDPKPVLDLRAAVESLSRQVAGSESETRRGLVALGVDVEGAGSRLTSLEASVAGLAESAAAVATLAARVENEEGRAATAYEELAGVRSDLRTVAQRLDSLEERLAAPSAADPERSSEEPSRAASLVARFETGAAKVDGLVAELQQALETRPDAADTELAEKLDALGRRVSGLTSEIAAAANADDASKQVQAVVDGLRMRLASMERELSALAGSQSVVAAIDDLRQRLESLEDGSPGPDHGDVLLPMAGDGRFRVELRALELRMEHAEAQAREGRDAVLAQLERLASRMEARLRRLEPAPEPVDRPAGDGQVIPIRTSEA